MMGTEALLRDPVFQLNLLIWMAKEQPEQGYRVRPLFFQNGFRLVYIEQPFAFPDATARAIESCHLDVGKAPEPDAILGRSVDQRALYFEAKANSFGPESSTAGQARAHLLACGPAFAETLKPLQDALLCYVVPGERCDMMTECLVALVNELRSASLAPGEHSVQGLAVHDHDIVYSWDDKLKQHAGFTGNSAAVLHELSDDTDPSPLLLVFTDEDCPNKGQAGFYRRVLINQVVARLVCDLNLLAPTVTYATTARDLLERTTDGVLQYVGRGRQSGMMRIVREKVFKRISEFWRPKDTTEVRLEGDRVEITFKDRPGKCEFMEWLEDPKRTLFSDERPAVEQTVLHGLGLTESENE